MIVKIDHVAYATDAWHESLAEWKEKGFEPLFEQRDLPNPAIKTPFLDDPAQQMHSLALLSAGGGVDIEITAYDKVFSKQSYLTPIFEGDGRFIAGFRVSATDLEASVLFWSLFGFVKTGSGNDCVEMFFSSPFSRNGLPFRLVVERAATFPASKLDTVGFCCIAFIETNLPRLLTRVEEAGFDATETESLTVNGKPLSIAFCRGNNGEIVEIIGLK